MGFDLEQLILDGGGDTTVSVPDWDEVGQLVDAVDRLDQTLREIIDVLREGFGLWAGGGGRWST